MPVCFQLYRKSDMTAGPVRLTQIDEEICAHFDVPVHDVKYYNDWYDVIGFALACGNSFEEILKHWDEDDAMKGDGWGERMREIRAFMDENYTPNSFWQPKELATNY